MYRLRNTASGNSAIEVLIASFRGRYTVRSNQHFTVRFWFAALCFVLICPRAIAQKDSREHRLLYAGGRYLSLSLSLQHLQRMYCQNLVVDQSAFEPALGRLIEASRPVDRDAIRKIYVEQRAQMEETARNGVTLGFNESLKRTKNKQDSCAEFYFFISRQQIDAFNEFRRNSGQR